MRNGDIQDVKLQSYTVFIEIELTEYNLIVFFRRGLRLFIPRDDSDFLISIGRPNNIEEIFWQLLLLA